jgi:CRP-like cAMP-binding protein
LLREVDLLSAVPESTLERLASALVRLAFRPGAVIVHEGDAGTYVYIIESGEVDLLRGSRRVAVLGPGECFGAESLLPDLVQPATAVARTALAVHALDGSMFAAAVCSEGREAPGEP